MEVEFKKLLDDKSSLSDKDMVEYLREKAYGPTPRRINSPFGIHPDQDIVEVPSSDDRLERGYRDQLWKLMLFEELYALEYKIKKEEVPWQI